MGLFSRGYDPRGSLDWYSDSESASAEYQYGGMYDYGYLRTGPPPSQAAVPLAHLGSDLPPISSEPRKPQAVPKRRGVVRNRGQCLFGIDEVEDGKHLVLRLHLGQWIFWWRV